jgi:apolipoprotein N-acyltransferase
MKKILWISIAIGAVAMIFAVAAPLLLLGAALAVLVFAIQKINTLPK